LWNGTDAPTLDNKGGKNNLRSFKSRSGHLLEFCDDKDNGEKVTLKSNGGAKVVLDDKNKKIEIYDQGGKNFVLIDGNSNKISVTSEGEMSIKAKTTLNIEAQDINMKATGGNISIKANTNLDMKASSNFTLKAGAQGTVQASSTLTVKGSQVNIN
jgi:hypothetical protein